ncbi:MAG TPA: CerR family C-terminal domain-containing protein [Gemmataceae bacterium]|nr:CerR family C-terminal domain-containing protein [Gemmataceae bacterium]
MARSTTSRRRSSSKPERTNHEESTRAHLLEVAGQVFAEKGFDRATGKEICKQAGTNAAAINYHFGGMDGLYASVVQEANSRLVTLEALSAAVAAQVDAKAKLEALLGLCVRTLTGPASSWVLRVFSRELVAPTPALAAMQGKEKQAKSRILKAIVGELMGLPEDHPAVARGCISILAPCLMLLIADRRMLKRVFPNLGLDAENAPSVMRHMVQFALAGLSAVARDARQNNQVDGRSRNPSNIH